MPMFGRFGLQNYNFYVEYKNLSSKNTFFYEDLTTLLPCGNFSIHSNKK